ncbi:MAG: GNAT family N-acetyltransferase [Peptostreptococcaceae bacterium]
MNLTIRNINKNNFEEIIKLKVSKEQVNYIETIEACLKEAREYPVYKPVAIYDKEKAIGFAMYGLFIDEGESGRVWLDRFLISKENQGKGYGKESIKVLINHLYKEYNYKKIYLSVYDNNEGAIGLYLKIGFIFNGELDVNGEKVMVLNISEKGCINE